MKEINGKTHIQMLWFRRPLLGHGGDCKRETVARHLAVLFLRAHGEYSIDGKA
jgi:hypothetical protein